MRTILTVLMLLTVLAAPVSASAAPKRVALVIGNGDYDNIRSLTGPPKDVEAITKTLVRKLGFKRSDVLTHKNLSFDETIAALKDFQSLAREADIAVIYYSGHGVAFNDANYLAPVDVPKNLVMTNTKADKVLHLDEVQEAIASADVGVIFWDACRSNSVTPAIGSKQTVATRGLIPVSSTNRKINAVGTFIAFSTNPQAVAYDGDNGGLSPFTRALIGRLATPKPFIDMMALVSEDVAKRMKSIGRRQVPEVRIPRLSQRAINFAFIKPRRVNRKPSAPAPRSTTPAPKKRDKILLPG